MIGLLSQRGKKIGFKTGYSPSAKASLEAKPKILNISLYSLNSGLGVVSNLSPAKKNPTPKKTKPVFLYSFLTRLKIQVLYSRRTPFSLFFLLVMRYLIFRIFVHQRFRRK